MPATSPSGSIAMALKFGTVRLNRNMLAASTTPNRNSGGLPPKAKAKITCSAPTATKPRMPVCDSRRMPSRRTSRELRKEAKPITIAISPKAIGK